MNIFNRLLRKTNLSDTTIIVMLAITQLPFFALIVFFLIPNLDLPSSNLRDLLLLASVVALFCFCFWSTSGIVDYLIDYDKPELTDEDYLRISDTYINMMESSESSELEIGWNHGWATARQWRQDEEKKYKKDIFAPPKSWRD